MFTLDTSTDIRLIDGTYRVVGRLGNNYRLKHQGNGDLSTSTLADIYSRLIDIPEQTATAPLHALNYLTAEETKEVDRWVAHIEEIHTGLRPGKKHARDGYNPALTTQEDRIGRKIQELSNVGQEVSRRTLLRKKALYLSGGPAALINRRKSLQTGALDRTDSRFIEAMSVVNGRQGNKPTVTTKRLFDLARAEVQLCNHADSVKVPSRATFYRQFKYITRDLYTDGTATNRRSKATVRNHTFGATQRFMPGEEAQIDSTKLNMYIQTKDGPARPTLTILQDRATRSIIAYSIRLEAAKGYDHSLMLASLLVPYASRPSDIAQRKLLAMRFPNHPLLSPEEHAHYQATRPFIYPRRITTDNGRDFLSNVFHSACHKYGMDVTFSAIHTPTDKPHVERNFKTIGTLFAESLPGYVGENVLARGYKPEDDDLLDAAMVNELFGDWVGKVWQNREHEGLRDLYDPSIIYSPNQWFNATADLVGVPLFPHREDTFIELMPSTDRTITSTGVQFQNRHYDSPELHRYRHMPSNRPGRRNQWVIKYNPYDVTRVWVLSHENTWLECRWRLEGMLDAPHTADLVQELHSERNQIAHAFAAQDGTPMPAPLVVGEPTDAELKELYEEFEAVEFAMYDDTLDSEATTETSTAALTSTEPNKE